MIEELMKGDNNMAKKPIKPKKDSSYDEMNKARDHYKSSIGASDTQQGISSESLEATVTKVLYDVLPKLIKSGNFDPSLLPESNTRVNQPINTNFMSMKDALSNIYLRAQQNQGSGVGNSQMDIIKSVLEIIAMMNPQQGNQGQSNNKIYEMLMASILKQSNSGNSEIIANLLNNVFQQNANLMNMMNRPSGQPQTDKMDVFMKGVDFTERRMGDKRERSKDEMEFDLKRKELEIQEYGRRDMLDREERQMIREDAKGARVMDVASTVLDKVVGDGLGQLVGDLMSVKNKKGGRRGRASKPPVQSYDASLLDEDL